MAEYAPMAEVEQQREIRIAHRRASLLQKRRTCFRALRSLVVLALVATLATFVVPGLNRMRGQWLRKLLQYKKEPLLSPARGEKEVIVIGKLKQKSSLFSNAKEEDIVLALHDRHVGFDWVRFSKDHQFGVVKIPRSQCTVTNSTNEATECMKKEHCQYRCAWTKKKFSSPNAPTEPDGNFAYWMDTKWEKDTEEARKFMLCAEFSLTYSVRVARIYTLAQVISREKGHNDVRDECRFREENGTKVHVDAYSSQWHFTAHDLSGIPHIPPGVIMATAETPEAREQEVSEKMKEIKRGQSFSVVKVTGEALALVAGAIAITIATGGVGLSHMIHTSEHLAVEHIREKTIHAGEHHTMEMGRGIHGNQMKSGSYAPLSGPFALEKQNIYVKQQSGIMETDKITCIFIPKVNYEATRPRCLALKGKDQKKISEKAGEMWDATVNKKKGRNDLVMVEDTSKGRCNDGAEPCSFTRELEMTEEETTARVLFRNQVLCRQQQGGVILISQAVADEAEYEDKCKWDILLASGGRVFVAREVGMEQKKWVLPWAAEEELEKGKCKVLPCETVPAPMHIINALLTDEELEVQLKVFLESADFDDLVLEEDSAFGKVAAAAVKGAGKDHLLDGKDASAEIEEFKTEIEASNSQITKLRGEVAEQSKKLNDQSEKLSEVQSKLIEVQSELKSK